MSALNALAVFVGAGLGGVGRYGLGLVLIQPAWLPFQIGTLAANLAGGFVAGRGATATQPPAGGVNGTAGGSSRW